MRSVVQRYEGRLRKKDSCEPHLRIRRQGNEARRFCCWHRTIHLMLAAQVGLERQPQSLVWLVNNSFDVRGHECKWRQFQIQLAFIERLCIIFNLRHGFARGAVRETQPICNGRQRCRDVLHLERATFIMRFEVLDQHEGQGVVAEVSNCDGRSHVGQL